MTRCRMSGGIVVLASVTAPCVVAAPPVVTPLVLQGDVVDGVGVVTAIADVALSDGGDWVVHVDTDNPSPGDDGVVLRNGEIVVREGTVLDTPAGATIDSFGAVNASGAGTSLWVFDLNGPPSGQDTGLFYESDLVIQGSDRVIAPSLPGATWRSFIDSCTNSNGSALVAGRVDNPAGFFGEHVLMFIDYDASNGTYSESVVAKQEQVLPGQSEGIFEFQFGPHHFATCTSGESIYVIRTYDFDSGVDTSIYVDQTLVAREGSPAPISGLTWRELASTVRVDVSDGHYVFRAPLSDNRMTIIRDGVPFLTEGDPAPNIAGSPPITFFGLGPVLVSDLGSVLWLGEWDGFGDDRAIFLDDQPIVQRGVTQVHGQTIVELAITERSYSMRDDASAIIFEGRLADGREGAFLVELTPACPQDINGTGEVDFDDLLAVLANWGPCVDCPADVNGSGSVDFDDLLDVLANWGSC